MWPLKGLPTCQALKGLPEAINRAPKGLPLFGFQKGLPRTKPGFQEDSPHVGSERTPYLLGSERTPQGTKQGPERTPFIWVPN
jgi:hypothetical protein